MKASSLQVSNARHFATVPAAGLLLGLALLLLPPAAAWAAPSDHAETGHFELFAGRYAPEESSINEETVYGLRSGYRLSDRLGLEGSLGYVGFSESIFDGDFFIVDASLKLYLNPGGKAEWYLIGGPGWAFIDVDASGAGLIEEDSFTLHAGLGVDIDLSERVYLRPEVRARWYELVDGTDLEATLALGFRIGG